MHIVVTRADVSKYGLQGLLNPQDDTALALDEFLALLRPAHCPASEGGDQAESPSTGALAARVSEAPLFGLWLDVLRLRARIQATLQKHPSPSLDDSDITSMVDDLANVGCVLSTALANDLNGLIGDAEREAAGLFPVKGHAVESVPVEPQAALA